MLAQARGWRLAEIRRRGRVCTREVLDRYVEALSGRLSLMVDFGDELLRVGDRHLRPTLMAYHYGQLWALHLRVFG